VNRDRCADDGLRQVIRDVVSMLHCLSAISVLSVVI
jgi:hypothetical protein